MKKLFSYTKENVELPVALKNCGAALQAGPAIALLYAPNWCRFGVFDGKDTLHGSDGKPINLDPVYEARIFNTNAELRWLNEAGGYGKAVVIAETKLDVTDFGGPTITETLAPLPQTYLLWGEGVDVTLATGWGLLTTARIGQMDAPVGDVAAKVRGAKPKDKVRVLLHVREYPAVVDDYGNVAVVDERLCELKTVVIERQANDSTNAMTGKGENNG
jgi:CRISPR-associated protein (TIGR03984 family)